MKIINKFLLISHIVFLASTFCSASNSVKNGLLWKISGKELKEPSYLFGTGHGISMVSATSVLDRIPHFYDAFSSVHQLIVERDLIDNNNYNKLELDMDSTYANYLNKEDKAYLDHILMKYIKISSDKLKLKPVYIIDMIKTKKSVEIYRDMLFKEFKPNGDVDEITLLELNHTSEVPMDFQLILKGKSANNLIIGLDDLIGFNLEKSASDGQPMSKQIEEMIRILKTNTLDSIIQNRLVLNKPLRDAYLKQDLDELEQCLAKSNLENNIPPELIDMIGIERNKKWMEHIPRLISDKPSLIAVGAAHLLGKDGLINLLKLQGFTVEPVN